jgi:hypothetical protein
MSAQLEATIDMKSTYVAICQIYANQKQSRNRRAASILNLLFALLSFTSEMLVTL